MYLTYEEYTNLGFHKVQMQSEFALLEMSARNLIKYHTMNRSENAQGDDLNAIKECMCFLIDNGLDRQNALKQLEQGVSTSRLGIASESVTDHSTSFVKLSEEDVAKTEKEFDKRALKIIRRSLLWTGLLYRGV